MINYWIFWCDQSIWIFLTSWKFLQCDQKLAVLVISIVIDCDRGHCDEHLKKKSNSDEKWAHDIYLNVCACDEFWAARRQKNDFFDFSGPTCLS